MTLSCDYGKIGEVTYFGVNPEDARGSCMTNDQNKACSVTNTDFAATIAKAAGDQSYSVSITVEDLWGDDYKTKADPTPAACYSDEAFFFAQFTCI